MKKMMLILFLSLMLVKNGFCIEVLNLNTNTNPATGDIIYEIDVSDPTDGINGTGKKGTIGKVLSLISGDCTVSTAGVITCGNIGLGGLTDVGTVTASAGSLLVGDGSAFQNVSITGSCTLSSAGVLNCADTAGATQLDELSDIGSSTKTAGNILIADGTNFQSKALSGACTITSAGLLNCGASAWIDAGSNVYNTTLLDKVGIGTSTPSTELEVAGTITAAQVSTTTGDLPQFQMVTTQTTDTDYTIGVNADGANDDDDNFQIVKGLALGTNVTINVTPGGDVGIGSTAPTSKLYVAGRIETNTDLKFADGTVQSSALLAPPGFNDDGTTVRLTTITDRVGIGNTAPTEVLDVTGSVLATTFVTPYSNIPALNLIPLQFNDTGYTVGTLADGGNDDDDYFQLVKGAVLGTTPLITVDTNGNVGIGVTAPTYKLQVNGTLKATSITFPDATTFSTATAAATQLTGLSDVGSSTKTAGNILIADGTNFQSKVMSGDITLSSAGVATIGAAKVGTTQLIPTGVTAGSYNAANVTVSANGRLSFAAQGQLTSLSDVASSTKTAGRMLIANGTNFASVSMSGSCTMDGTGAISCPSASGATQLTGLSDVGSSTVTAGRLLIADGTKFQSVAMGGGVGTLTSAGTFSLTDASVALTKLGTLSSGNILVGNAGGTVVSVNPSGLVDVSSTGAFSLTDTAVTPGSYIATNLTVDADGRITAASTGMVKGQCTLDGGTTATCTATVPSGCLPICTYNSGSTPHTISCSVTTTTLTAVSATTLDGGVVNYHCF